MQMVKMRRLAQMQAYSKSKSFMITTPIKEGEADHSPLPADMLASTRPNHSQWKAFTIWFCDSDNREKDKRKVRFGNVQIRNTYTTRPWNPASRSTIPSLLARRPIIVPISHHHYSLLPLPPPRSPPSPRSPPPHDHHHHHHHTGAHSAQGANELALEHDRDRPELEE